MPKPKPNFSWWQGYNFGILTACFLVAIMTMITGSVATPGYLFSFMFCFWSCNFLLVLFGYSQRKKF